jgi:hypothetical protein
MTVTIVWHYTNSVRLCDIVDDGVIKPGKQWFEIRHPVWFSSDPDWEPTANHLMGRRARVGVDPATAPYRWEDYAEVAGVKQELADDLYNNAIWLKSNPDGWLLAFEPVPREKWVAVELFNGSAWVPVNEDWRTP